MKCERNSGGREHDHHTLQVMRQQTVKAVHNGESVDNVSAAMGLLANLSDGHGSYFGDSYRLATAVNNCFTQF